MKKLIAFVFCLLPLAAFCQDLDSLRVAGEVDSLIKVSQGYNAKRDFDKAIEVIVFAEKIALENLGRESAGYGRACHNHGRALHDNGNYKEALKWYVESKDIREIVLGREHLDYAASMSDIGIMHAAMGNYEIAIPIIVEVINIEEKTIGKENASYLHSLKILAQVYDKMSNYEKAEKIYLEILNVTETSLGKEHPSYPKILSTLGRMYTEIGSYEKAEKLLLEANKIEINILGKENYNYAVTLNNIATLYGETRNYEKAEPFILEAKDVIGKVLGKEHPIYALLLTNLANLYVNLKMYEKAENSLLEAKDIMAKTIGIEHSDFGLLLNNLADLYRKMGNFEKVEPLILEAKNITEKTLGKENLDYTACLNNLATLYWTLSDFKVVGTLLLEASAIEKSLLIKATRHLSEREMFSYIVSFLDKLNQVYSFAQLNHGTYDACYDNALFYNGFLLNISSWANNLAFGDSIANEKYLQLKSYHRLLSAEYANPIAERDSTVVVDLESKANTLEKELALTVAGFGETLRQVTWNEVQENLKVGEAAIEFIHFQYQNPKPTDTIFYAALLLTPTSTAPTFIPLCQEADLLAILDQPQGYRQGYFDRLYRGIKPKVGAKTEGLYQLLWQPLDSLLQGTKRIYYTPSGLLHRINLTALPTGQGASIGSTYELVQLGSTRQLVTKNNQAFTNKDAVVLGGINYEATPLEGGQGGADDAIAFGSSPDFNGLTRSLRGGEWKYLEGTAKEATDITKLLKNKGFKAQKMSGHAATEEVFKSIGQGSPSPRVLHIATHGFFFPDTKAATNSPSLGGGGGEAVFKQSDNPMIRSGLLLAGANPVWKGEPTPAGKEDGILTAYEISQMNLSNTELVVLSACETGLGDIQGNEGVYGLQRAFKIAGAKHLIMSLWDVPDVETAEFMAHFYKEWLGGKDIHAAFRSTQRAMQEAYPQEPFLWAGFVLVE